MPAVNPRLTVTVTKAVAAAFAELSELTGNSQSRLIGELLEGSLPTFHNMIRVLRAAKDVQGKARESFVADLDEAEGRMRAVLGIAQHLSDTDVVQFEGAAAAARPGAQRERAARPGRGGNPRPVTRGSTPVRGSPQTGAKSGKGRSSRSGQKGGAL